jgi:predicted HicB family RNase H-like nuclease
MATKKKAKRRPSGPSGANLQPRFTLRAPQEAFDDWQAFADAAGLPLNRWICDALNEACQRALLKESVKRTSPPCKPRSS